MKSGRLLSSNPNKLSIPFINESDLLIATSYAYNKDFNKAELQLSNILRRGNISSIQYFETLKHYFHVLIYINKLKEAELILRKILNTAMNSETSAISKKWCYYHIYYKFLNGQYKLALDLLYKYQNIIKSGTLLSYYYRILEVLILIELKKFEVCEFKQEALIQSLKKNKGVQSPRINFICKCLKYVVSYQYNFASAKVAIRNYRNKKMMNDKVFWQPFGYELKSIETWVESKIKIPIDLQN